MRNIRQYFCSPRSVRNPEIFAHHDLLAELLVPKTSNTYITRANPVRLNVTGTAAVVIVAVAVVLVLVFGLVLVLVVVVVVVVVVSLWVLPWPFLVSFSFVVDGGHDFVNVVKDSCR